jgi:hypothetical protein
LLDFTTALGYRLALYLTSLKLSSVTLNLVCYADPGGCRPPRRAFAQKVLYLHPYLPEHTYTPTTPTHRAHASSPQYPKVKAKRYRIERCVSCTAHAARSDHKPITSPQVKASHPHQKEPPEKQLVNPSPSDTKQWPEPVLSVLLPIFVSSLLRLNSLCWANYFRIESGLFLLYLQSVPASTTLY